MYKPTKRTINWGKDKHFIKLFYTKVSRKWWLTVDNRAPRHLVKVGIEEVWDADARVPVQTKKV